MDALAQLADLSAAPFNRSLQQWKSHGGKIIGFFCAYIPEEIPYAAGVLPYRMRPTGCARTTLADGYMSSYNCSFAKSCLQYALGGEFSFLDGIVSMNSCDHIRRLYDVWRETAPMPYMSFLSVPHTKGKEAQEWYVQELAGFQKGIEDFVHRKVQKADLRHSVDVYNHTRQLLRQLYETRKEDAPPLSGTQVHQVVLAASAGPREEYNHLLEQLLKEIQGRHSGDGECPRLMVMGSAYDEPAFTQMLESVGGRVVADALCFGGRYFWEPVPTEGDPLPSLARSYLNRPNCARMAGGVPEIADFALAMAREFRVDGIIYQRMRWCDLWGGAILLLQKRFQEQGIPVLPLEREYALTGVGQLRNRVEAFLETLRG